MARAKALQTSDDGLARSQRLAFGSLSLAALILIIIGHSLTGALLVPA
mgnify:FL=1|tara:strand:+ start:2048 stop:2191 length:144 start_codon:yes stop_codon:yes gene_type:complete